MLYFYLLNELISNLMPATGFKKVGTGVVSCSQTFTLTAEGLE